MVFHLQISLKTSVKTQHVKEFKKMLNQRSFCPYATTNSNIFTPTTIIMKMIIQRRIRTMIFVFMQ